MAEEIVIKIDVQSGKAQAKLKDTEKEIDGVSRAEGQRIKLQKELNFLLSQEAKELASLKIAIRDQKAANDAYAQSQIGGSKAAKQFRTQAGLNNAILLESGRLASDLSFGFTAVANNLSQLVSLFGSFVNTTGSVGESLKQLKNSLLGTGGILLAVQLFIAALQSKRVQEFISSLFGATAAVKALNKALDEATDTYGKQIGRLETLTRLLQDQNLNESQRVQVLKKLKKENEDINFQTDENNQLTAESNAQIERKITLLRRQAETQSLLAAIEAERVKQLKTENSSVADNVDLFEYLGLVIRNFGNIQSTVTDAVTEGEKDRQKELNKSSEIINKLYDELRVLFEGDDDTDGDGGRRIRRFKAGLLDLSRAILGYEKQASKIRVTSAEEQLDLDEQYALMEADRRFASFKKQQEQRLENYKNQVKDRDDASQLIAEAETRMEQSLVNARAESNNLKIAIEEAYVTERILLADATAKRIAKIERDIENVELGRLQKSFLFNEEFYNRKERQILNDINLQEIALASTQMTTEDRKKAELELEKLKDESFKLEIQRQEKLLSQNQLLDFGLQGDMTYYQNRISLLDEFISKQKDMLDDESIDEERREQIRGRIAENALERIQTIKEAELAATEARMNVQQEYISFVGGASEFLKNVAGENKALLDAALIIEKGAAIADVVVRTQAANAQITAGHLAAAATESAVVPFSAPANVAKQSKFAAAQIARNNTAAGISIANILATTISSFNKPGGETSIDSVPVSAPAFNVVGASTTDQLLQGVQGAIGDIKVNLNLNEVNDGIDTLNTLQQTSEVTS